MIDNMPVEKAVCRFLGKRRQTRSERGAQRGKEKSVKYNASFEGYHVCTLKNDMKNNDQKTHLYL